MAPSSRLRALDDRLLRDRSTPARESWGRRHGWTLFGLLGVSMLGVCAWELSDDLPTAFAMNVPFAVGFLALAVYLFVKRDRSRG